MIFHINFKDGPLTPLRHFLHIAENTYALQYIGSFLARGFSHLAEAGLTPFFFFFLIARRTGKFFVYSRIHGGQNCSATIQTFRPFILHFPCYDPHAGAVQNRDFKATDAYVKRVTGVSMRKASPGALSEVIEQLKRWLERIDTVTV